MIAWIVISISTSLFSSWDLIRSILLMMISFFTFCHSCKWFTLFYFAQGKIEPRTCFDLYIKQWIIFENISCKHFILKFILKKFFQNIFWNFLYYSCIFFPVIDLKITLRISSILYSGISWLLFEIFRMDFNRSSFSTDLI